MIFSTILKFNGRYYKRRRSLALLCLLGIALGVGIVVAVELINESALASFSKSIDFLSGRADYSVISDQGRLSEAEFVTLWKNRKIKAAAPVVDVMSQTVETGSSAVRFLGIDPLLDTEVRGFIPRGGGQESFVAFIAGDPPGVYVSESLSKRYGLAKGDTLTALPAGVKRKLQILGTIPTTGVGEYDENLALVDISTAQDVFGREGYLDRIDLITTAGREELAKDLPSGLRVIDANDRKSTLKAMLYSFQLNLAAMSLLALFVGVFLIYNFSMFSVLSRRQDMSLLMTLGADRRRLVTAFIVESLIFGLGGGLLGLLFGTLVAKISIGRVSATITDIYFYVNVADVRLNTPVVLLGLAVGFIATLIGSLLPTLEVALTPPVLGMKRQSIEDRARSVKGLLFGAGLVLLVGSVIAAWASKYHIVWGFVAAFGVTTAFALFTPAVLTVFSQRGGPFLKKLLHSLEVFLAARTIQASLSRTGIAVAALATALSMTIGVDTMIHSFRLSVESWLAGSLHGDLYISPATTKWSHPLPDELIHMLDNDPQIEAVEKYATYEMYLEDKPVKLRIVDANVLEGRVEYIFLKSNPRPWKRLRDGGVFISESLGFKFKLNLGDKVTLSSPQGPLSFPIVGITRDYSSDQGTIQMHRGVYQNAWNDSRVQSVALFLKPGVSQDEIRSKISTSFPGLGRAIVSNEKMKKTVLIIFDKTFAPTATLKGVSLLVALLGVAGALTAILIERSKDMATLGFLGLTPGQIGKMNVYQAVLMGVVSFLISCVCGLALTIVIIEAINYRSFGWSIDIHLNPWIFAKAFVVTIGACLLAAVYPTYKVMRSRTAGMPRED